MYVWNSLFKCHIWFYSEKANGMNSLTQKFKPPSFLFLYLYNNLGHAWAISALSQSLTMVNFHLIVTKALKWTIKCFLQLIPSFLLCFRNKSKSDDFQKTTIKCMCKIHCRPQTCIGTVCVVWAPKKIHPHDILSTFLRTSFSTFNTF